MKSLILIPQEQNEWLLQRDEHIEISFGEILDWKNVKLRDVMPTQYCRHNKAYKKQKESVELQHERVERRSKIN